MQAARSLIQIGFRSYGAARSGVGRRWLLREAQSARQLSNGPGGLMRSEAMLSSLAAGRKFATVGSRRYPSDRRFLSDGPSGPTRRSASTPPHNQIPKSYSEEAAEVGGGEEGLGQYRRNLYITYHDLEVAMQRRGYSLYRLLVGTLIAVAAAIALFWNRIKHWGAQESASVATRTLEDEMLQKKAEELAKQLTNALLKDERTLRAVQTLLQQILSDPIARQDAAAFVSQLLMVLLQRDDTKQLFATFLGDVLGYDIVKRRAVDLGVWVAGHPIVVERVKVSLMDILKDGTARDSGKDYAMDATRRTLQDESTKDWLLGLVENVFVDPQFQEKAGEALWNATKSGVLGIRSNSNRQAVAKALEATEEAQTETTEEPVEAEKLETEQVGPENQDSNGIAHDEEKQDGD